MIGALLRVIAGFVLASFAAGLAFVLFAVPPSELASARSPGLGTIADWTLKAGTQAAIFSAPFALIAAAIGEWQRLRNPVFYGMAGLCIAIAGFLAQRSSETFGQETVLNAYAVTAFMAAGLLAGAVYWLLAGRVAGDEDEERASAPPAAVRPAAIPPAAPKPAAEPAEANVAEANPAGTKRPEAAAPEKAAEAGSGPAKGSAARVENANAAVNETHPLAKNPEVKA